MNNTCTYTFETSGSSVYSIPTYRIPIEGVITSEQGFNSGDIVVVGKSYQSEIVPLYINDSQLAGEKVSVFNGKILFKLKITDVLFTYVMGSTKAFKELNMTFNDFSFCIELPIKAKKKIIY